MERRRHQRLSVENFTVDASDGVGFLQGAVIDLSRFGVRVTGLQRRKGGEPPKMTFIINGQGENSRYGQAQMVDRAGRQQIPRC